jgi:Fur family ferric uptake transcriptional regulator
MPKTLDIVKESTLGEAQNRLDHLKSRGFRITNVRRVVMEIFSAASQPISALQLLSSLKERSLNVNKTTVYRELEFLMLNKVISELDLLDGMKRYELLHADHHHHHLVCTSCQKIQCVEMNNDLDEIEALIKRRYQFHVKAHVLEFFGVCSNCTS